MKKIALSVCLVTALLQAQELPFKIFAESYAAADEGKFQQTYKRLKEHLEAYEGINVVDRASGKYRVIMVETVMEKEKFNDLYKRVVSHPSHKDAFWLPAPELLKDTEFKEAIKVAKATKNKPKAKKEQKPAPVPALVEALKEETPTPMPVVKASTSNPADMYFLQHTVKTMLTTNPKLQETIFNYIQVGKDVEIADRGYYPTLDLTANYGYERVRSGSTGGEFKTGNRKEAQLTFVQNLYNGNGTEYRINQEKSRLDAAAYSIAEQADRLSLQMVSAYLNVIKEKALLDLAYENVSTHKDIYGQIKDRTDSGFGRVSEQRQAGSRLTLAQSNLISQENNYNDALNTFEKLSGLKVKAEQLVLPSLNVGLPESEEVLREKAFTCNPSIKVQQANIDLAHHLKDGTKVAFRPNLDFEAYARIGDDLSAAGVRDDTYSALLRLRYNLYNKGIDTVEEEKSQVLIQQEMQTLENLKRDLHESLRFSWQSYVLSKKKLSFLEEHKGFSQETLEAYKEEFKIGRRDLINLLDAEGEYYSARREILTTENDLLYAKYRLLDNMGMLSDSFEPGFAQRYIKGACSIDDNL